MTLCFCIIICFKDKIDFDDINKNINRHINEISNNETNGEFKLINIKIAIMNLINIKLYRVLQKIFKNVLTYTKSNKS